MAIRDQADPYLNPSPQENRTPEFGKESRGYDEDRSWLGRTAGESAKNAALGGLFAGLGDFLTLKTKVEDNFFKNRIDEEVTAAVDLQRDAEIISLGGTSPNVNREPVPDLLVQELKKADSLTAAKRAGSVRDPYYWNRMDVIARETRQRYPGHREYIDQKIASMLGTTPANALVRELQSRQAAGASQIDKDKQHWERFILERTTLGPAYMAAKARGQDWSIDTMKAEGTAYMSKQLSLENSSKQLAFEEAQGRAVENDAERTGRDTANFVVQNAVKPFVGPETEFAKTTERMRQQIARGETVNPQDEAQARALIIQARQQAIAAVENEGNRLIKRPDGTTTSLKSMMGQEKWNNVKSLAESQLRAIEDAYNNKTANILEHNLAYVNSITNTAKGRMLSQNDHALLLNTVREVLGPQGMDQYLTQNPELRTAFIKSTQGEALLKMFQGIQPAKEIQRRFQAVIGEKNPVALQSQIDTVVRTMKDPTTPDRGVLGLANTFFSPANHGYIAEMDTAAQHNMYLKLTDPGIAKRLYDMRAQYPEVWRNYQNWSTDTFLALNNKDLNDAKSIITDRKNIALGWDQTSGRLLLQTVQSEWNPSLNAEQRYISQTVENRMQEGAKDVVDRLNKSMDGLRTQIALEGRDPKIELPKTLKRLTGLDTSLDKTGSGTENLFVWINDLMNQVLGPTSNETREQYDKRVQENTPIWRAGRSNYRLPGESRAGLRDIAAQQTLEENLRGARELVEGDLREMGGGNVGQYARPALEGSLGVPGLRPEEMGTEIPGLYPGYSIDTNATPEERRAAEIEEIDQRDAADAIAHQQGRLPTKPRVVREGRDRRNVGLKDIAKSAANQNSAGANAQQIKEFQDMLKDQVKAGLGGGPIAKTLEQLIKDMQGRK